MGIGTIRWRLVGWGCAVLLILVLCLIWAAQLYVVTHTVSRPFADFIVFWTAARLPDSQVYDPIAVTHAAGWYFNAFAPRPFSYPPSALVLFRLLAGIDFFAAAWLWTGLSSASFAVAVWRWGGWRVALLALVAPPTLYALAAGQTTLVVGALITSAALQLERRPLVAGALIAIAALIKPQLVVLVPVTLFVAGRWGVLVSAGATGLVCATFCILFQGTEIWWNWIEALTRFLDQAAAARVLGANVTPAGTGLPFAGMAGIALGFLLAWRAARLPANVMLHGAMMAGLLALPYALPYDLAAIAPLACVWLLDRKGAPFGWAAGLAILSALAGPIGLLAGAIYNFWLTIRPQSEPGPIQATS